MSDIDIVQEVEKELSSEKPITKKKRTTKSLTMSGRMRIIEDFRNGIPDKYYSVSAHPRKAGEYILRKRRNPLTYDIERPVKDAIINKSVDVPINGCITCMSASESTNETSKVPSEMLKSENPLAGTEFFSMYSNLNASLQRELDSLHEKFNKLDAKFRKERASRKNKSSRKKQEEEQQEENEYEYEYVDEQVLPGKFKEFDEPPQAPPVDTIPMNPLHATRPRINIFDYF